MNEQINNYLKNINNYFIDLDNKFSQIEISNYKLTDNINEIEKILKNIDNNILLQIIIKIYKKLKKSIQNYQNIKYN